MGKIALWDSFSHRLPLHGCCENIVAFARRSPIKRFDGFPAEASSLENLDKAGVDRNNLDLALATAQGGEMLGNKLIYLEAGSGAKQAVPLEMIALVSQNIEISLLVGGGIVDLHGIQNAFNAGADLVIIRNGF